MIDFLRELFGLKPRRRRSHRVNPGEVLVATANQRSNSSRHSPPPLPPVVPRNRVPAVPSPVPPENPRTSSRESRDASRRGSRRKRAALGPALEASLLASAEASGRFLIRFGRWLLRLLKWVLIIGVPVAAVAVPMWLMVREVRGVGIEIGALSVPAKLVERGIKPDVLAARLSDQIEAVRRAALADPTERPANELRGIDVTVEITATSGIWHRSAVALRDLFGLWTTELTGELVEAPDGGLALRLRVPGFGQVVDLKANTEAELDRMIVAAGPEVWQVAMPRLYAWWAFQNVYQQEALWGRLEGLRNTGRLDPATLNTVSFLLIKVLVNGSRVDDAAEFAENLITRSPGYAPGWYARAMTKLVTGHPDEALEAGQKMIEVDGGSVWGRKATARLLMQAGRFNEAYREVRAAARINPEDIEAMILESSLHSSLGRVDDGIATARRAVEFRPTHPGVHEVFANALMAKKLYPAALAELDTEVKNHPTRISTRLLRANVLLTMNRPKEALDDSESVLKETPNAGQAIMVRGWSLLALGRPAEALLMMNVLLNARVQNPGILEAKAMALEALGDRNAAVVYIHRALQQAPGNAQFLADLERLSGRAE